MRTAPDTQARSRKRSTCLPGPGEFLGRPISSRAIIVKTPSPFVRGRRAEGRRVRVQDLVSRSVFIASAVRTAIGKFGGSLASLSAADLGVIAVQEALARACVQAADVNEVVIGHARAAGNGPNPARQISYRAGVPQEVPAYTVNKACGSGLKAIILGHQEIVLGNAEIVVAGGTESMSTVPYLVEQARWGLRMGNHHFIDGMYRDGFYCPLSELVMGETAENLATMYKITLDEQDQFAVRSQERAAVATRSKRFAAELIPVSVPGKKGETKR